MPSAPAPPTPPRVPPGSLSSGEGGVGHTAKGRGIRARGLPAWGSCEERCNLGLEGQELRIRAVDE
eukprot:996975-Alexandrium_andersonii.AAC.1